MILVASVAQKLLFAYQYVVGTHTKPGSAMLVNHLKLGTYFFASP